MVDYSLNGLEFLLMTLSIVSVELQTRLKEVGMIATDGDAPGQALAEELARRLGRERCQGVKWPKKDEVNHFKDANEVRY
ncbi:hypothetical protein Patl1_11546 [Pistacia atlantica]|uniref:Uncharacterized protein n=1 Tax=Pistacia atlantica TaxID=434234 RepID=A0ACC1A1I2_9ROSI|nr:hypothetical protein Patl1_11546 [Pistacia atlantica]